MALYDGSNIFGLAVRMQMIENPTAHQLNAFFGLHGVQSLFGGLRGRMFPVEGVLYGVDLTALNNAESLWFSYIDGIARNLVDTRGRTWPQVLVQPIRQTNKILQDGRGYYLPYAGALMGLI